jgi:hypothetical protein
VAGKPGATGWPVKVMRGANRPALWICWTDPHRVGDDPVALGSEILLVALIDRGRGVIGQRGRASPRGLQPVEYLHQFRER